MRSKRVRRVLGQRVLLLEQLEPRQMLCGDAAATTECQNASHPLDVNDDLSISPIDVLLVVNRLNDSASAAPDGTFMDSNGDGTVSPIDALLVINKLNDPTPETVVRLVNDTDRDGGSTRDRRTYDLTLTGRVNFGGDSPTLYVSVGSGQDARLVDISNHVDAAGYFSINDRRLRELLGDDLEHGSLQLQFRSLPETVHERTVPVEVLVAPPMPQLTAAVVDEDAMVVLDIVGNTHAPDSSFESLQTIVIAAPTHGTLVNDGSSLAYQPFADFHGTDSLVYQVSDGQNASNPTTLKLTVAAVNDPPVIAPIVDQSFNVVDRMIEIPFSVSDVDGDRLTNFGYAVVANPLAEIRAEFGLTYGGDALYDLTGLKEKWLLGNDDTSFFLLPNGDLVQWLGDFSTTATREALIARLDASIYEDPALLVNAAPVALAPLSIEVVDEHVVIIPQPGLYGDVHVTVISADGTATTQTEFVVSIDPSYDDMQAERDAIAALVEQAATVDYASLPSLYEALAQQRDALPADVGAEITDLLRRLAEIRRSQNDLLSASQQWTADETRIARAEVAELESLVSDLELLQSEYAAAWSSFQSQLDTSIQLSDTMAPLFLNGNRYNTPIQVRRGERLLLDLRAVHPLGEPLYGFVDYQLLPGHGHLSLDIQTGLFDWPVPAHASGTYDFTIKAFKAGREARVSFRVEVLANEPTIGSVEVRPGTVTDKGTDAITLVAHGVTHPTETAYDVAFFQDRDGDGVFQDGIDSWLGNANLEYRSWTGTPFPVEQGTTATFFARASVATDVTRLYSPVAAVTAPLLQTPTLDVNALQSNDDVTVLGSMTFDGQTRIPSTRNTARYGQDLGAFVTDTIQRLTDVDAVGRGTNTGAPVSLGDFHVSGVIARADRDGNLTVVFTTTFAGPGGTDVPSIWLARYNAQNEPIAPPVKLMSNPGDEFAFTMDMNESGQGVIAWKGYYSAAEVYLQTFTGGGEQLGPLHRFEYYGGYHDGGEWNTSAVNASGRYVVAWPNYAVFADVDDTNPQVTLTNYPPNHLAKSGNAAINQDGWVVISQYHDAQVFDPSGRSVGFPVKTTEGIEFASQYIPFVDVNFASETVLHLFWLRDTGGGRYEFIRRTMDLIRHSDVAVENLRVDDAKLPVAGQPLDIFFGIRNAASEPTGSLGIAFYVSHDDELTAADRLLGTVKLTEGIASDAAGEFTASIVLPVNEDPIWSHGSTELRLIMVVPTAGQQSAVVLPFVQTTLQTLTVTPPISTVPGSGPPATPPPTTGPKFIRPGVVAEQNGPAGFSKSVHMMELIAFQFISAARLLWARAPYTLQGQIAQMIDEVQVRLDTFFYDVFTLQQARATAESNAAKIRDDAVNAARAAEAAGLAAEQAARNKVVQYNQPLIDAEQARLQQRVLHKTRELQSKLSTAEQQLAALDGSEAQIDSVAATLNEGQNGFALFGGDDRFVLPPPNEVFTDGLTAIQQGVQQLSARYTQLKQELQSKLTPVVTRLKSDLNRVNTIVQQEIDRAVAPLKEAVNQAETRLREQTTKLQNTRRKLVNAAQKTYDDTIAKLPDLNDQVAKVKTSAMPALSSVGDNIGAVVANIRASGGLLETAQENLQALCCEQSPYGSIDQLLEVSKVSGQIVDAVMQEIGETLTPVLDQLNESGGKFADWAKDRGGAVSDWTKDQGEKISDWYHDVLGKLDATFGDLFVESEAADYYVWKLSVVQTAADSYQLIGEVTDTPFADDGKPWGARWTVEADGGIEHNDYLPLQRTPGTLTSTFMSGVPGQRTITLALKDQQNIWYTKDRGSIELPLADCDPNDAASVAAGHCSVDIFYNPRLDPANQNNSNGNSGGGGGNDGGGAVSPVYTVPAAEIRRGFQLPYLLASAGIYTDDNGELRLGFDMVETTEDPAGVEETQTAAVFTRLDREGEEVSESDETQAQFSARIEAEIAIQRQLKEALDGFPDWFFRTQNELGVDGAREDENRKLAAVCEEYPDDEPCPPLWTEDTWLRHLLDAFWHGGSGAYPQAVGSIDEALGAEAKLIELNSRSWTPDQLPSFSLTGDEVANGLKLPPEVANASDGTQWGITVNVKESVNSRRVETTRIAEPINAELLAQARTKGAANWQKLRALMEGKIRANRERDAFDRETEDLRALRTVAVSRAVSDAFRMTQEDAEDLFGLAVPGFSFIISGGRTYLYAKAGDVVGAFVEGAFTLLDVLTVGAGGELAGKIGRMVPNPFQKGAPRVVQLSEEFIEKGADFAAQSLRTGASRIPQIAKELRDVGMDPRHAKKMQNFFAAGKMLEVETEFIEDGVKKIIKEQRNVGGDLFAVVRSSNPKGVDYHALQGFKPKPESLKFKTDPGTGLVRGSQLNGKFVDARGQVTHYTLRKADANHPGAYKIFAPEGSDTGYFLTSDGFVTDAANNRFFADYDLMGVYESSTTAPGKFQPVSLGGYNPNTKRWEPGELLGQLNRAVDDVLNMFQHGGNDEFWKVRFGEVGLGNELIGDMFTVFYPNGLVEVVNFAGLREIYRKLGINWPY